MFQAQNLRGLRACGKWVEPKGGQWGWSEESREVGSTGQEQATQGTMAEGLDFILRAVGNCRSVGVFEPSCEQHRADVRSLCIRDDAALRSGLEMDQSGRPRATQEVGVVVQRRQAAPGESAHDYFLNTYSVPGEPNRRRTLSSQS